MILLLILIIENMVISSNVLQKCKSLILGDNPLHMEEILC